jgi:predicted HTH domain antitoxin
MEITVELPNDLTERPDPAREALEAVAIAGYRSGNLTAFEAGRLLGFRSRFEFEGFLKGRGIYAFAYSADDLAEDVNTVRKLDRPTGGASKA